MSRNVEKAGKEVERKEGKLTHSTENIYTEQLNNVNSPILTSWK